MLRSKHGEIKKNISCVLSADANEWKGNYVSHSCKVEISEIAFFQPLEKWAQEGKQFTACII